MTASRALLAVLLVATLGCDDQGPDRRSDGGSDARGCEAERAFFASRRACTKDDDCTIVGSCTGPISMTPVQTSARAEAERYADSSSCRSATDGPTYLAACEQGHCVARNRGYDCGQRADASVYQCADDEALYVLSCSTLATPVCARRCSGQDDVTCRTGTCQRVSVSQVIGAYGLGCGEMIDVWLCRP